MKYIIGKLIICFSLIHTCLAQKVTNTAKIDEQVQKWIPYPEKADLLVIMAHPDDEIVWGGALTYYAKCQKKKVILITLTSGEYGNGLPHPVADGAKPDCSYDDSDYPCFSKIPEKDLVYPCYYREKELDCAAQGYGLVYKPIYVRLKDMAGIQPWGQEEGGFEFWGGKEKVIETIVYYIRKFQPDVVLGMDWNGWNGNPQHIASSRGLYYASPQAGNKTKFPEQLNELKPWQPQKVYMHLPYKEVDELTRCLIHRWDSSCEELKGKTVQEIFGNAYACHQSQEMTAWCAEKTYFILKSSTVGTDSPGVNDFFENILNK